MKKTNLDGKLKLSTETVLSLQADVLANVNGGAADYPTRISCLSCILGCGGSQVTKPGGSQ